MQMEDSICKFKKLLKNDKEEILNNNTFQQLTIFLFPVYCLTLCFVHLHHWAVVILSYIHLPFIVLYMNGIRQGNSMCFKNIDMNVQVT